MTETLFGRPINGDPQPTREPTDQGPDEDFLSALDALLDIPGVEAVRWDQYTPYFNDGEACEFNVYEPSVKFSGVEEDAGDEEDGFIDSYSTYDYDWKYKPDGTIDHSAPTPKIYRTFGDLSGEEFSHQIEKFSNVLTSGRHDVLLGRSFGDHARVLATKDGFDVEYYEHD